MSLTPVCSSCGSSFPEKTVPWRCPACGGVYDLPRLPAFAPEGVRSDLPGIWRYRRWLALPEGVPPVWLGEGGTPLVPVSVGTSVVHCKLESQNPTGSFKDRGSAVLVSFLRSRGVGEAVEDSSGNAGASLAAYCACAGLRAQIFVPATASGPKRMQIAAAGATVVPVPGPRSAAAAAVRAQVERGAVYASHAFLPHGLSGMATIAFELVEALGGAPAMVVAPVGHGTLLSGLYLGFRALLDGGRVSRLPRLVAVQAQACAPVWKAWQGPEAGGTAVEEGVTIAEGIRVLHPVRATSALEAVRVSKGEVRVVGEEAIRAAQQDLARRGLLVEATSAVVWAALLEMGARQELQEGTASGGRVVAVLTGHGLKDTGTYAPS